MISQWHSNRPIESESKAETQPQTRDAVCFSAAHTFSAPLRDQTYPELVYRPLQFQNAVSIVSARTTKRFPLSRCASAIQIVRPLESIAETQPQLQPALLRLSAITSHYFILRRACSSQ